jgi:hypothetical protein
MSFPSPALVPPSFSQYPMMQFGGPNSGNVFFGGSSNPFQMRGDPGSLGLEGLDMPTVQQGDTSAPRVHGQYIGLDLLSGRDITVTLDVGPPYGAYGSLETAMDYLRAILTPSGTTECPLYFQLTSTSPQLVSMVRPRKRTNNIDIPYVAGLAQTVAIQFHATDPALYAAQTLDPSVAVPAPLGGMSFNISFNVSFGGGSEAGIINATNYGDLPCYPIIIFTGPCTYPTLTNSSITNSPYVQFAVTMNAGDTLVINTDPKYRSAQYYTAGSTVGSTRLGTLTQGSNWWPLPGGYTSSDPFTSILQFTTLDASPVDGSCTVEYSSAYSAAN